MEAELPFLGITQQGHLFSPSCTPIACQALDSPRNLGLAGAYISGTILCSLSIVAGSDKDVVLVLKMQAPT